MVALPAYGQQQPSSLPQSLIAPALPQSWNPFPTTNLLSQPVKPTATSGGAAPAAPQVAAYTSPNVLAQFSIDGRETWTDNAFLTSAGVKPDFISVVTPTASITGESRIFDLGLNYSGSYSAYVVNPSLDGFQHNGIATLTTQLVPDQLFLDTRGTISQQSINPTGPTTGGTRNSPEAQTRVIDVAMTPRLQERIGSWAAAELTGTYQRTINQEIGPVSSPGTTASASGPSLGNSSLNQGTFELRSGPDFAQVLWDFSSNGSETVQSTGTMVQTTNQLAGEYRISHTLGALVSVGYDTVSGLQIDGSKYGGLFYSGGLHWTPNPDTDLRIGGGWRYGASEIYALLNQQVGRKTSIRVSQNVGITTDASSILDSLESVQRDAQGNYVDPFSGLAANPAGSSFPFSNGAFRQQTTEVAVNWSGMRDSMVVSTTLTQQQAISGAATLVTPVTGVPLASSSSVLTGTVTWTHDLTPSTTSSASINGSDTVSANQATALVKSVGATLTLTYQLNDSLTGNAGYQFSQTFEPAGGLGSSPAVNGSIRDNTVFLELSKQF